MKRSSYSKLTLGITGMESLMRQSMPTGTPKLTETDQNGPTNNLTGKMNMNMSKTTSTVQI